MSSWWRKVAELNGGRPTQHGSWSRIVASLEGITDRRSGSWARKLALDAGAGSAGRGSWARRYATALGRTGPGSSWPRIVAQVTSDISDSAFALSLSPLAYYRFSGANLRANSDGTGAVGAGSTAGFALDLSGNGHHLSEASASARPTYTEASGLKYILGDGGDDLEAALAITGVNLYVAVALKPVVTGSFARCVSLANGAANDFDNAASAVPVLQLNTTSLWGAFCNSTQLGTNNAVVDGTACVLESIFTSAQHVFSKNGTDSAGAASPHNLNTTRLRLLGAAQGGNNLNGQIASLFVRLSAPTSGQRASLRTEMGAHVGLSL